jgi:SAM-dependent methyltransferase
MATKNTVWEEVFAGLGITPEEILRKINKHLSQRDSMFAAIEQFVGTDLQGKRIVEVGAGTAIECLLFAMKGARCFAIDFEQKAMRYAGTTASFFSKKPYLNVGTGFALPVKDSSADLVLSQGFLEHFEEMEILALLKEQVRILKPSGILLIDVPNYYSSYEIYKRINSLFGNWVYGKEVGIKKNTMVAMAASCGLEVVGNYGWSFKGYPHKSIFDFFYMFPLLLLRNVLQLFGFGYDSIGILFRKKQRL